MIKTTLRFAPLMLIGIIPQVHAADPRIGTWEVISMHSVSDHPFQITIVDIPGGLKAKGPGPGMRPATTEEFAAQWDGSEAPVTGTQDEDQVALRRIDQRSFEAVFKKGGNTADSMTFAISSDGNEALVSRVSVGRTARLTFDRTGGQPVDPAKPFTAIWTLNSDKTTQSSQVQQPPIAFAAEGGDGVQCSSGRKGYSAKFDGKDYPSRGTDAETVSLNQIDPHTIEEIYKRGGKVIDQTRWVVAEDGQSAKATTNAVMPDGTHVTMQVTLKKK